MLVFSVAIGVPLGVAAGYFGGWVDDVIMRITDIFLAFPALLLSLALAAVLTPERRQRDAGDRHHLVALVRPADPRPGGLGRRPAATSRLPGARASRGSRIVLRHVLPNSITPVLVQASLDVGGVILTAAALSFLGLGAQDPTPEWGLMVSQGQAYFDPVVARDVPRAWRSCSPRSASTCWATGCAPSSTRGDGDAVIAIRDLQIAFGPARGGARARARRRPAARSSGWWARAARASR